MGTAGLLLAALVLFAVGKRASNLSKIDFRIGGLRWVGVEGGDILTDLVFVIANPSKDTITIEQTAAQIQHNGSLIGFASQLQPVNIKPYAETTLKVRTRLPLISILKIAPSIIASRKLEGLHIVGNMVAAGVEYPIDQPINLTA